MSRRGSIPRSAATSTRSRLLGRIGYRYAILLEGQARRAPTGEALEHPRHQLLLTATVYAGGKQDFKRGFELGAARAGFKLPAHNLGQPGTWVQGSEGTLQLEGEDSHALRIAQLYPPAIF